jgi:hypothetical protein
MCKLSGIVSQRQRWIIIFMRNAYLEELLETCYVLFQHAVTKKWDIITKIITLLLPCSTR